MEVYPFQKPLKNDEIRILQRCILRFLPIKQNLFMGTQNFLHGHLLLHSISDRNTQMNLLRMRIFEKILQQKLLKPLLLRELLKQRFSLKCRNDFEKDEMLRQMHSQPNCNQIMHENSNEQQTIFLLKNMKRKNFMHESMK